MILPTVVYRDAQTFILPSLLLWPPSMCHCSMWLGYTAWDMSLVKWTDTSPTLHETLPLSRVTEMFVLRTVASNFLFCRFLFRHFIYSILAIRQNQYEALAFGSKTLRNDVHHLAKWESHRTFVITPSMAHGELSTLGWHGGRKTLAQEEKVGSRMSPCVPSCFDVLMLDCGPWSISQSNMYLPNCTVLSSLA